jgi:hypothetical protein
MAAGSKPAGAPTSDGGKGFRWLAQVIIPLVVVSIGGLLTWWFIWYPARHWPLHYRVVRQSAIMAKPDLGGQDFQIIVGGHPVDNVSTVSVELYNDTDYDVRGEVACPT